MEEILLECINLRKLKVFLTQVACNMLLTTCQLDKNVETLTSAETVMDLLPHQRIQALQTAWP